jgi:hypothetical protein
VLGAFRNNIGRGAPALHAEASALAASFVPAGIASGDDAVLKRILPLLTSPIEQLANNEISWYVVNALLGYGRGPSKNSQFDSGSWLAAKNVRMPNGQRCRLSAPRLGP